MTGRVEIGGDKLPAGEMVSGELTVKPVTDSMRGVVMAVYGVVQAGGVFEVDDYCFAALGVQVRVSLLINFQRACSAHCPMWKETSTYASCLALEFVQAARCVLSCFIELSPSDHGHT